MKRRLLLFVPVLALICTIVYLAAVSLNQTTEPSSAAPGQINEQDLPEDLDQAIKWLATQEPVVAPQMKFERSPISVGREPREVRYRDLIMVTCDGVRHQMAPRDFGPWAVQMRDSRIKRLRIVMPYNPFGQQIIELWRLANWEQLRDLDLARFYGYNGRQLAPDAWRSLPGLDLPQVSSQWIGGPLNFAPMTNVDRVYLYNPTAEEIHAIVPAIAVYQIQYRPQHGSHLPRQSPALAVTSEGSTVALNSTDGAWNLGPVRELPELNSIHLEESAASLDFAQLANLRRLDTLSLRWCACNNDLAAVAKFAARVGVKSLDLSGTKATDLAPLASVTSLQELILDHALYVDDVSPLETMASVQWLILTDCPNVPLDAIRQLQSALPKCAVHFDLRPYPERTFQPTEAEKEMLNSLGDALRSP